MKNCKYEVMHYSVKLATEGLFGQWIMHGHSKQLARKLFISSVQVAPLSLPDHMHIFSADFSPAYPWMQFTDDMLIVV